MPGQLFASSVLSNSDVHDANETSVDGGSSLSIVEHGPLDGELSLARKYGEGYGNPKTEGLKCELELNSVRSPKETPRSAKFQGIGPAWTTTTACQGVRATKCLLAIRVSMGTKSRNIRRSMV